VKIDMTKMVRMSIHIERLVLDGLPVDRSDGPAVKEAVEEELKRLLAGGYLEQELLCRGSFSSVKTNDIYIAGKMHPQTIGEQVARAIYGGLRD
jgi:hypothetical protein